MTDRFNSMGEITDLTTIACIDHLKTHIKQRFNCLIDSGAKPLEIMLIAQKACEAMGDASDETIADYLRQLEEIKKEEDGECSRRVSR